MDTATPHGAAVPAPDLPKLRDEYPAIVRTSDLNESRRRAIQCNMSINLSCTRHLSAGFGTAMRSLLAAPFILLSGESAAHANPDVWVEAGMTYLFEQGRVSGIAYEWSFDEFFSSSMLAAFDADGDGALDPEEAARLRVQAFDPLSESGYFVHLWENGERRRDFTVDSFAAGIDDSRLVYRFTVVLTPPADPARGGFAASLHDDEIYVDFDFRKSGFLLVEGAMGSGCRFRVARGRGAQAGHRQVVTLNCGEEG